jgi:hypothetical protein
MTDSPKPLSGGLSDSLVKERASAMPSARISRGLTAKEAAKGGGKAIDASLRGLQEWFAAVIMNPQSAYAGIEQAATAGFLGINKKTGLERIVTRGPSLSAAERMRVYHYAYHARLIDCLADDYPTLKYALGDAAFERLCRDYLVVHPSRGPNLNVYGAKMSAFCRERKGRFPLRGFAAELATLEWSMVEIIHAQAAPTLALAELQKLPVEQWADLRFVPSQTVKLLDFAYPVNQFLQRYRDEKKPKVPKPAWSGTVVYRQGPSLWRMDLTRTMAHILTGLFAGKTLGDALTTMPKTRDPERLSRMLMVWFREWVEGGIFASLS